MDLKIIRTDTEYGVALAELDRLMEMDPEDGSPEANLLEVLALLLEQYERERWPIHAPDPISAIEFRMEQAGLEPRDLIPFIGSRSRVSEVLSGKRTLSLSMIRALSTGLDIPTEVLLRDPVPDDGDEGIDWSRFPLKEMARRGWIDQGYEKDIPDSIKGFFLGAGRDDYSVLRFLRKSAHCRSARSMDQYALVAWTARVCERCNADPPNERFVSSQLDLEVMREIARLSSRKDGPIRAQRALRDIGICMIVEPHLPRTYIDGAAILTAKDRPVIGLTLRYDRIDNFWFTLMHEVAHVALHLFSDADQFFDDLDYEENSDKKEVEADALAGEALVPSDNWMKSPARIIPSPQAANHLAAELGVHPAVVAGRIRHETGSYRILNNLVGHGEVRKIFSNVDSSQL